MAKQCILRTPPPRENNAASENLSRYDYAYLIFTRTRLCRNYTALLYSHKNPLTQYHNVIIYNRHVDNRKGKRMAFRLYALNKTFSAYNKRSFFYYGQN